MQYTRYLHYSNINALAIISENISNPKTGFEITNT